MKFSYVWLDWTGLGWTGLDWTELGWTELGWAGLVLGWAGLVLDWTGPDWAGGRGMSESCTRYVSCNKKLREILKLV